jgi:hypothetical protein
MGCSLGLAQCHRRAHGGRAFFAGNEAVGPPDLRINLPKSGTAPVARQLKSNRRAYEPETIPADLNHRAAPVRSFDGGGAQSFLEPARIKDRARARVADGLEHRNRGAADERAEVPDCTTHP